MILIHMDDMIIIHVYSVSFLSFLSFLFLQMTLLFGFMNIIYYINIDTYEMR